jgi:hypothetical protein
MNRHQQRRAGNLIELNRIAGDDDNPRLPPEATLEFTGPDLFVKLAGVRIAKRQDKNWISLEPGYTVLGGKDGKHLLVEFALVTRQ